MLPSISTTYIKILVHGIKYNAHNLPRIMSEKQKRLMAKNKIKIVSFFIAAFPVLFFLFSAGFSIFPFPPVVFAVDLSLNQAAQQLCSGDSCVINSPNQIFAILAKIVRWTYTIFFIVAVFFILLAAFNFLTAQGDSEKIKGARDQILWASVAIVVALISVGAAQIIKNFIK